MGRPRRARARWPSASPRTSACPTSTPACSTAPWPATCSGAAARSTTPARPPRRRAALDPATLDDPGLRGPGAGEAASIVAAHPAGARGPARVPARLCPPAARRRARRPRHRHRGVPRGRREDLRHRHPRGARPAALLEMTGRGEPSTYEARPGRHPPPRRARRRPGRGPHAAGRRRLLAGYQQFGYRSRIRYGRRRDPRGRLANAGAPEERGSNPSWHKDTPADELTQSWARGWNAAACVPRRGISSSGSPTAQIAGNAWSRSRNEHRRQ